MAEFVLTLYVAGTTAISARAIANLHHLCQEELGGQCEPVVIDVLARPRLARAERILATPTLIKSRPLPRRRIIGDLSDTEKVLRGLAL